MPDVQMVLWQYVHRCQHRGRTCSRCCWLWQGHRDKQGYGYLTIRGRTIPAHRLMLEYHAGAMILPSARVAHRASPVCQFVVMHQCDNPPCVNPRHLRFGTITDNVQDARKKRRIAQVLRLRMDDLDPLETEDALHA